MEKIRSILDENESRLHYILGTLQKIQVIIEADGLDDGVNNEDMNDLNVHLETFSENLKNIMLEMFEIIEHFFENFVSGMVK